MINLMFEAQAQAAFEEANLLLKGRIFRIDVITRPGEFSLDNAAPDKIAQLMNLGRGEAVKRQTLEAVKSRFVSTPAPNFIPFRNAASRRACLKQRNLGRPPPTIVTLLPASASRYLDRRGLGSLLGSQHSRETAYSLPLTG
jgi:hypothetical protein